ncbi:hypothetical protein SAMN05216490_4398 [Mucilaginibacter mallensis]|uniref:Uncharacterized protein n=1 Tax=Mucilaginibacter mallensis TaxID=652787 RepID=A0A1H2BX45_MUCMA|nr:hypothetical protein [Mucilaginibacter mallensis]SDT62336.1 hypothetical protein SAMN05216490_4398 [Mucilaginibacter mallensis]
MKVFSDNRKILITQIISYVIFASAILGKNISSIAPILSSYKYFLIVAFFVTQAFMIYFIIQEKKQQAAKNHLEE